MNEQIKARIAAINAQMDATTKRYKEADAILAGSAVLDTTYSRLCWDVDQKRVCCVEDDGTPMVEMPIRDRMDMLSDLDDLIEAALKNTEEYLGISTARKDREP